MVPIHFLTINVMSIYMALYFFRKTRWKNSISLRMLRSNLVHISDFYRVEQVDNFRQTAGDLWECKWNWCSLQVVNGKNRKLNFENSWNFGKKRKDEPEWNLQEEQRGPQEMVELALDTESLRGVE